MNIRNGNSRCFSMTDFQEVLLQDLDTFSKSIEHSNLELCNILANRIIANASALKLKEFLLLGCLFKRTIFFLGKITNPDSQSSLIKKFQIVVIEIKKNVDINYFFDKIFKFSKEISDILVSEDEKNGYKENLEFTKYYTQYLVKFLRKEIQMQQQVLKIDMIYSGIQNELDRVMRCHGFTPQELMLEIMINYSGRLFEYLRVLMILEKENNSDHWKKQWAGFEKKIDINLVEYLDRNDTYNKVSLELLMELCEEWRLMFVRMLEPFPRLPINEKQIELPKEVKDKITKMITDNIKKDLNVKVEE